MKYIISIIFFLFLMIASCKDKAKLVNIENKESLSQSSEHLIDDSEKLVELSNLLLTSLDISKNILEYPQLNSSIQSVNKFFQERNKNLLDDADKTANELGVTILKAPSEQMVTEIEKYRDESNWENLKSNFSDWIQQYSNDLEQIATWMVQSSDNKKVIDLGAKVNSYSYALKRELSFLNN